MPLYNSDSHLNDAELGRSRVFWPGLINLGLESKVQPYVPHSDGMPSMSPEAAARAQAQLDSRADPEAVAKKSSKPPSELTDANPWGAGPHA